MNVVHYRITQYRKSTKNTQHNSTEKVGERLEALTIWPTRTMYQTVQGIFFSYLVSGEYTYIYACSLVDLYQNSVYGMQTSSALFGKGRHY